MNQSNVSIVILKWNQTAFLSYLPAMLLVVATIPKFKERSLEFP